MIAFSRDLDEMDVDSGKYFVISSVTFIGTIS